MDIIKGKSIFKSWTFWGAVLIGVSATLSELSVEYPTLLSISQSLGYVITALGLRRAISMEPTTKK